jgi:hypothetical protein
MEMWLEASGDISCQKRPSPGKDDPEKPSRTSGRYSRIPKAGHSSCIRSNSSDAQAWDFRTQKKFDGPYHPVGGPCATSFPKAICNHTAVYQVMMWSPPLSTCHHLKPSPAWRQSGQGGQPFPLKHAQDCAEVTDRSSDTTSRVAAQSCDNLIQPVASSRIYSSPSARSSNRLSAKMKASVIGSPSEAIGMTCSKLSSPNWG